MKLNVEIVLLTILLGVVFVRGETDRCNLPKKLRREIASYKKDVDQILNYVIEGPYKGKTYDDLAEFVDKFGNRLTGTDTLEQAIDFLIEKTKFEGIADIVTEKFEVPFWKRGEEKVFLIAPRFKSIDVTGLGYSVSTPSEGLKSETIVVKDFEELDTIDASEIKGKIVVFDQEYVSYGVSVPLRYSAADRASAKGAIAALIRSITPFSIASPHTGTQTYSDNVPRIPVAAIATEDADFLRRIQNRGEKTMLFVKLISILETKTSRNTLIDLKGNSKSEQLVIVSGHIDSWDNGQGAMDDGGGIMISRAAPVILNNLKKQPRRTLRAILWTGEETGLLGATAYKNRHFDELKSINFIMESDVGTFNPYGLRSVGTEKGLCIVAEILKLFKATNTSTLIESKSAGSDIGMFVSQGIPSGELLTDNDKYFWFHHTVGDTMNIENSDDLDKNTAFWTAFSYVVADISVDMPKTV